MEDQGSSAFDLRVLPDEDCRWPVIE